MAKEEINQTDKNRILRHPMIYSGYIKLKICREDKIEEITITKKDKEKYKIARKSEVGDLI